MFGQVRDDVVRADDDTPDIISVQHTRSLRQMWTQIERDRDQPAPPRRPTADRAPAEGGASAGPGRSREAGRREGRAR